MRQRSKYLSLLFMFALTLGLFGCSNNAPSDANASNGGESATESSTGEESELKSEEFKDVVLIDNDAVTITLEKFYQRETNWARSSGKFEPMTTNEVAVKIKDKTDYGTLVNTKAYLDDEELFLSHSGNNAIDSGKAVSISYTIGKDTQPDWTPLDSFDDLYNVVLNFEILKKNESGAYQAGSDAIIAEVKLGDAIEGKGPGKDESEKQEDSSNDAKEQEQKKAEVKPINVGDSISNDNWEIKLIRAELTDEALPNDTSSYYWSYEASDGTLMLDLVYEVKVVASKAKSLDDIFGGARVTYAGKYEYETIEVYYDDDGGHLKNAARVSFDPLQTWQIHYMIFGVPEEALSNSESIKALLLINDQLWELNYR